MNDRTEVQVFQEPRQLTAASIRANVNLVQEVMQAVMKKDTHYGTIPGTPKPTLYKPGAEKLAQAFRIAVSYVVEELSTPDAVRYRVTATGTHQTSGIIMGAGMGECSTAEEKYKWRKASNWREFEATADDRKRVKYGYNKTERQDYEIQQVRTEPADLANTILKMACKRAQVAMILNVTAASDCFTQDIEDLPEELRPQDDGAPRAEAKPSGPPPYADADFQVDIKKFAKLVVAGKKTPEAILTMIGTKVTPSAEQVKAILALKKGEGGAPEVTFAQVEEKLRDCSDVELLHAHADLIRMVTDAKQREDLTAVYHKRKAELEGGQ